jgi:DNA polymerase-1
VSDVHVYTPERVELRYGVRPDQVPDFIGLKGDSSDNIPGIPGIGDKTAGQLIAQYGSLEAVIEHADELSPARGKAVREHAEQARESNLLATMRRDLPLDVDPAALVSTRPPLLAKEMFRRFEFRALLISVDELDAALPARAGRKAGVPWGGSPEGRRPFGLASGPGRARGDEGVGRRPLRLAVSPPTAEIAAPTKALRLPFHPRTTR